VLVSACAVYGETIILKNGHTIKAKLLYRTKGTLWYRLSGTGVDGDMGVALSDVESIANDDGSVSKYDFKGMSVQAGAYVARKEYQKARALYSQLIEIFPADPLLRRMRAMLHHKLKDFDQALADYHFLIEHRAADREVLNNIAAIHIALGEVAEASKWLELVVRLEPTDPLAHRHLGMLALRREDYPAAIEEFLTALAQDSDDIEALFNSGYAYIRLSDYPKAAVQMQRVLALDPAHADALSAMQFLKAKAGTRGK
jgi:tetratricopeptide (TPR) repeat protein